MELENKKTQTLLPSNFIKQHWILYLLIILSLLHITGRIIDIYHFFLLKPLPIALLMFLAQRKTRQQKSFFLGLLFSLGGDLCLMYDHPSIFQLGTALFFAAHLLYIYAFLHDVSWQGLLNFSPSRQLIFITFSCIIIIQLLFNIYTLWSKTPNFPLFLIYGFVLSAMGIIASLRSTKNPSYYLILFGALMFGISDNTLAYFKFNSIQNQITIAFVMTTYYLAQYLITQGIIKKNYQSFLS